MIEALAFAVLVFVAVCIGSVLDYARECETRGH